MFSRSHPSLRKFRLSNNFFGDAGAESFAKVIGYMYVCFAVLCDVGRVHQSNAWRHSLSCFPAGEMVSLLPWIYPSMSLGTLVRAPWPNCSGTRFMQTLSRLRFCMLVYDSACCLLSGLEHSGNNTLSELNLNGNQISDVGAVALAEAVGCASIIYICFSSSFLFSSKAIGLGWSFVL